MQRNAHFSLLGVAGLLLGGCGALGGLSGGGSTPIDSLAPLSTEHPLYKQGLSRDNAPLVARYYWANSVNRKINDKDMTVDEANYGGLRYRPRQSNYKGFEGWDIFEVQVWTDETRSDLVRVQLNRDARVTVVWEDSALWLAGWQKGGLSTSGKTYNTFTKDFRAGEIALGSPTTGSKGKDSARYFVLLAERGGAASKPPALPAGIAESDRPQPNSTCPDWLENTWTVKQVYGITAPDGQDYKTWHPQVDPIYWCYYGHDHGSDPSLVGYKPAFEYVAKRFNDQPELHVGFKGFAIRDEGANQGWYINVHSETGVQTRACARFHPVVVAVTDLKTGELKAELAYKGDFGATISNRDNNPPVNLTCTDPKTGQPVTQTQIQSQTESSKNVRVSGNGQDPGGYENWHGGGNTALGMSFWGDDKNPTGTALNIDIRNPTTFCADNTCASVRSTGDVADERTIRFANLRIQYTDAIAALDKADGKQDGYFWTDLYGEPLPAGKNPGDPGTIRQFIKPGFDSGTGDGVGLRDSYSTEDAWRGVYKQDLGVPRIGLENGLTGQN